MRTVLELFIFFFEHVHEHFKKKDMNQEDAETENEILEQLQKYIREKEVGSETSQLLAKLSLGFAKQIAFELNDLLSTKDVQTNDLRQVLSNNDFDEIANAVHDHLDEVLIDRKKRIFEALRQTDYVSKNYHFEFARQLLSSKHKESTLEATNEYSDDDV